MKVCVPTSRRWSSLQAEIKVGQGAQLRVRVLPWDPARLELWPWQLEAGVSRGQGRISWVCVWEGLLCPLPPLQSPTGLCSWRDLGAFWGTGQGDPLWLTFCFFPPLPLLVQLSSLLPTTSNTGYLSCLLLPPSEPLLWKDVSLGPERVGRCFFTPWRLSCKISARSRLAGVQPVPLGCKRLW